MKDKLKSCPFCGGNAILTRTSQPAEEDRLTAVMCIDCVCQGEHFFDEEDAITNWNTRANPVTEEEILKELDKIPSTHVPISKIEDKIYYYMCKEDIAKSIMNLINKEE